MEDRIRLEELYGRNVFTLSKMKERLPKSVYRNVLEVMQGGGELSRADADVVAKAMKDWAMENGATHYTHWFQLESQLKSMTRLWLLRMKTDIW